MISTSAKSEKLETFAKRFAVALRRRLYPNTGLHIKQLAYTMRRSEATVWSWLKGERTVRGDDIMACLAFFGADFANELLQPAGCVVVKMDDARAAAARKIAEGYAELAAMEGGR